MAGFPESPMDSEDVVYPCKGCGEILEEGKAFELAGHRWHLECFKCNTCGTILDSDANLLLLGDGSLICNNCTYSCSACNNKIQDLAILTGDQAYCAGCFRCRNCKRKIENLRYARTSQGMFCMECHDALMARRRKKTKNAAQRPRQQESKALLDKSLPLLPPTAVVESSAFSPDSDRAFTDPSTPTDLPGSGAGVRNTVLRTTSSERKEAPQELETNVVETKDEGSETLWVNKYADTLAVPPRKSNRNSAMSDVSDAGDGFFIPMALDPSIVSSPLEEAGKSADKENTPPGGLSSDYFTRKVDAVARKPTHDVRKDSQHQTNSKPASQTTSPRTSFKDGGRLQSDTRLDILSAVQPRGSSERSRDPSPLLPRRDSENERFQLQEAPPKRKKSVSAKEAILGGIRSAPLSPSDVSQYRRPSPVQQTMNAFSTQAETSSSASNGVTGDARRSSSHQQLGALPKRGDSLLAGRANVQSTIQRKEVGGRATSKTDTSSDTTSQGLLSGGHPDVDSPSSTYTPSPGINGGLIIGKPRESPISKSFLDYPQRSENQLSASGEASDSFASPRAAPEAPERPKHHRGKSASVSTFGDAAGGSLNTTKIHVGDASSNEDRFGDNENIFKRVSNSVRHARSHSDRTIARHSRDNKAGWPKTPVNGSATADLLSGISPSVGSIGSPDSQKEIDWYRQELRQMRLKLNEKDDHIRDLQNAMEGKTTIKQMNTELREKRSTMVVLDTQKEIVVRELEVLTEHIATAKKSGEPLDLTKVTNVVLHDFAESLQRLKDSFTPQIEELLEKKTIMLQEIIELTERRDRAFTEFEQISIKNAQLIEINNSMEHPPPRSESRQMTQPQGLGIYGHHAKDTSVASIAGSSLRPGTNDTHGTSSTLVADLSSEEPVFMAPKVVDVRKGQAKKFNWKKGGIVAKSVGKGLKDAFSSDRERPDPRETSIGAPLQLEGTPYGVMSSGQYPSTTLPKDYKIGDQAAYSAYGQQRGKQQQQQHQQGRSTPLGSGQLGAPPAEPPNVLFGSLLQARAEYEGVEIPGIIVRCIQEVQSRGMDAEGIYRKSGGSGQIQEVKEGFSHDPNFDISDNELDINAVTSALKQYFRKLPIPLITFEVYDRLLATAPVNPVQQQMGGSTKGGDDGQNRPPDSKEERIERTREALAGLPNAHRATLEFLIFHLAKVVKLERVNLMTSLNCAVVFAPTIMRPMDIMREMTDTASKNDCVRFMIENCEAVFMSG